MTDQIDSQTEKTNPHPIEPPVPQCAMSIQAHPDDQEFSVAGTLAKWARAGSRIISLIITSGDAGNNDIDHDETYKPILAELREKEQLAANSIIGITKTEFLRYPDGTLEATIELRRDITRMIRKYKPDIVICGDPTIRFYGNSYLNHPDHRAAANAACDAVFPSAGTRLIFPELLHEGFEPHNVKYLFLHGSEKSDTWIDITETIEIKIQALQQHKSQLEVENIGKGIREWAQSDAKEHGMQYAESYLRMVLVDEAK